MTAAKSEDESRVKDDNNTITDRAYYALNFDLI